MAFGSAAVPPSLSAISDAPSANDASVRIVAVVRLTDVSHREDVATRVGGCDRWR